jgi:hypothetical protein
MKAETSATPQVASEHQMGQAIEVRKQLDALLLIGRGCQHLERLGVDAAFFQKLVKPIAAEELMSCWSRIQQGWCGRVRSGCHAVQYP